MSGALRGLKIVDLTNVVFGPYATQLLADQGADVVKVEAPEGDIVRQIGEPKRPGGMGPTFHMVNRNKRSLCLDLKKPAARDALLRLVAGADAFVHALRPQAVAGLGLSYDDLRAANPEIVYAAGYGYGADGPYAKLPAYDDAIQARSGAAALMGGAEFAEGRGPPRYAPTILADKTCGLTLAYAVLCALVHKLRTGKGQFVEVPMFETMAAYLMVEHLWYRTQRPEGEVGYSRMLAPTRRPFATKDGWICILPYTDRHWIRFFEVAGRADLAADPRFGSVTARSANIAEAYGAIEALAPSRSTAEWIAALEAAEIPCAPVNRLEDLLRDPHLEARGLFRVREHPFEGEILTVEPPVRFSATPSAVTRHAPMLGEHGAETLREAGLSEAEIEALRRDGALVETAP